MRRPSATGVIAASAAWLVAWTPSLLPNGSLFQGVTLGVLAAVGYALGAIAGSLGRRWWWSRKQLARPTPRWYVLSAAAVATIAVLSGLRLGSWEAAQAASIGAPQFTARWLVATAVGLAVLVLLVAAARGLRLLTQWVARASLRLLGRRGSAGLAQGIAVVVMCAAGLALVVGAGQAMRLAFDRIDASVAGQVAPSSAARSGSPTSLVAWESLGAQGRAFVAGGRDNATIRAFAGLASASDAQARAELAVADMLRAGGANSDVWIGITTTGNGYIDPVAAETADEVSAGKAALVAIQYSTLPSWLSFLVNQSAAADAGTALYEALAAARESLPPDQRPKLVLYGESLGAYGSPAPFAGLEPEQVSERIDGALWVGPPAATDPITAWTYSGAAPVWQPVLDSGRVARYAATLPAATAPPPAASPWPNPRILVLQNPTDPVVWFSPGLVWRDPAWLADPRGPGVPPQTRWTPVLFFLQVALDLPQAVDYPSGYGHNYADALRPAWEQILAP